jgi:hypothetical protein
VIWLRIFGFSLYISVCYLALEAAILDHPIGSGSEGGFRLGFDARVRLEFHGSKPTFPK